VHPPAARQLLPQQALGNPILQPLPPAPSPAQVPLTVVVPWVCDVLLEAVNGAQAAHCCLAAEANERQHGQAPVLQLLELPVIIAHAHGVEGEGAQHTALHNSHDTPQQQPISVSQLMLSSATNRSGDRVTAAAASAVLLHCCCCAR